jgi:predicted DNA-binding transcriptional regulator AlpA
MTNTLNSLPADISWHRILNAAEAAKFWGVSLPHWRRLYRANEVPSPIKLSARRLGWRASDLIDALEIRATTAA